MKTDDLDRITEMVVCPTCRDIVGWFCLEGRGPLLQRSRCVLHPPRPDAPAWPGFDFNQGVDLCYCCGIEPLTSGSRWSIWFCQECREQVCLLNARHGRCVVPIGRHSAHWGWTVRREELDDPIVVESFLAVARAMGPTIQALSDWHHFAIQLNLEEIGAAWGPPVPIRTYHRRVQRSVDRMERFREMCAYLDRYGRLMAGKRESVAEGDGAIG